VIHGIIIRWGCDECGYSQTEHYGAEDTNSPTIQATPPNMNREGERMHCDECHAGYED
jgi:hypothetical protein